MALTASRVQMVIAADTQQLSEGVRRAQETINAFAVTSGKRFENFSGRLERLRKPIESVGLDFDKIKRSMADNRALDSASRALQQVARDAQLTSKEIRAIESAMGLKPGSTLASRFQRDTEAATALGGAITIAKAALAGYVGFSSFGDIARTAVDLQSMQKTFYALTGSMQGARGEITYLQGEAQRLGLDFFALTDSFKGFMAAGKTANMPANQIRNIFTAVTEASTVLGLNAQRTKLALYALEQMLSKGSVTMEELRRQLGDQLPGAFQLAAKAMNMTTGELSKLIQTGQLSSAEFLPKFAVELSKAYGPGLAEAMKTPRAELQRLRNEMTFAKLEIGEGGFLQGLSKSAKELRGALQTDKMKSSLQQFGYALGTVTGGLSKLLSVGLNSSTGILALGAAFGTANIAAKAIIPTVKSLSGAFGSIRVAGGIRTAGGLAAIGGPAGLATGALAALAGGVAYLSIQQSEAEKYAAKYAASIASIAAGGDIATGALDKMRSEIKAMSKEMRGFESEKLTKSIYSISGQISSLFSKDASIWDMLEKEAGAPLEGPFAKAKGLVFYSQEFRDEIAKIGKETGFTDTADKIIALSRDLEEATLRQKEFNDEANHTGGVVSIASMSVKAYADAMVDLAGTMRLVTEYGKDIDAAVGNALDPEKVKKAFQKAEYEDFTSTLSKASKEAAKGMKGLGLSVTQMRQALKGDFTFLPKDADKERLQELLQIWEKTGGSKSSGGGGLSLDRTSYQSDKYLSSARDAVEQLQSKHAELVAQLRGSGLEAALSKIEGSYAASFAKIAQERKKYDADLAMWTKKGRAGGETAENIRQALAQLDVQEEWLKRNKDIEDALARQAQLEKEAAAESSYAKMLGDVRAMYDAEARLNSIKLASANIDAERLGLLEAIRQAEARRDMNVSGLMLTGVYEQSRQAGEKYIKFFEDLPGAASTAADAVGAFAADVGFSTKSMGDAWSDFGKSLQKIVQQMIADLTSLYIRMAIFGSAGGGGGGLFGMLGGLFTSSPSIGGFSRDASGFGWLSWNAQGNAFADTPGLGRYRNSIVSSPTVFPFARGIGLMGEKPGSPGEAIMPLERNSRGDLSVNVTGAASAPANVNVQVINQVSDSAEVSVRQTPSVNGGANLEVLITRKVQADFASGRYDGAMRRRYGQRAIPG